MKPTLEQLSEQVKERLIVQFETPHMTCNLYQHNQDVLRNFGTWYMRRKRQSDFSMTIDDAFSHYIQNYHRRSQ